MNNEWLQIQANNGVCEIGTELEHDPDMTEIRNDYRWTPQVPARFFGGACLWRQRPARGEACG
ncbi:hypothetical protein [Sphingorhabdus sp. EL138]|uniref:hypothetical protein n=1 Tax=Sphingorhabdus sp. EL138 TaxID=2073156 RepID=UPI0025E83071|nr:hypothetical protein [Sphingorhabdus sp. EL138]